MIQPLNLIYIFYVTIFFAQTKQENFVSKAWMESNLKNWGMNLQQERVNG